MLWGSFCSRVPEDQAKGTGWLWWCPFPVLFLYLVPSRKNLAPYGPMLAQHGPSAPACCLSVALAEGRAHLLCPLQSAVTPVGHAPTCAILSSPQHSLRGWGGGASCGHLMSPAPRTGNST